MSDDTHVHKLAGCAPTPLASYLKAIGILRLIAEQADPKAHGWWSGDVFHLRSTLDRNALLRFFLEDYSPTPLVGPWGARSGFYADQSEASSRNALNEIQESTLDRLAHFRTVVSSLRAILHHHGFENKPSEDDELGKWRLKVLCRANLPDEVIPWVDAAFVLMGTTPRFPIILGTGGNEGSGSYMSGFSQQIVSLMIHRKYDAAISSSLFGGAIVNSLTTQTPGHFAPDATGGPNASSESVGEIAMNPWDYILMLEGVIVFAGSCVKKLESHNDHSLAFPFTVNQCGVGYPSASAADEHTSRGETWLPLWSRPAPYLEIAAAFAEGRAGLGRRKATTSVDFSRAVAILGTDRGFAAFQRFGFLTRNGDRSTFAVSLGRVAASPQSQVRLIDEIDEWLDGFRRGVGLKTAPARARRVLTHLEAAIQTLCRRGGPSSLQEVLIALGEAGATLSESSEWRELSFQRPLPLLSPDWLMESDDLTTEFRLSASLASVFSAKTGWLRQYIDPIEYKGALTDQRLQWIAWTDGPSALSRVVWKTRRLQDNLIAVLHRRIIDAVRYEERAADGTLVFPDQCILPASLSNISAFLKRTTDDDRIGSLIRGLVLLDWSRVKEHRVKSDLPTVPNDSLPSGSFAILKLCHTHCPIRSFYVRLDPTIAHRGVAGDAHEAIPIASRRLTASGLTPALQTAGILPVSVRRMIAALLFPVSKRDVDRLASLVLRPQSVDSNDN